MDSPEVAPPAAPPRRARAPLPGVGVDDRRAIDVQTPSSIATHILAFEGESQVRFFEGNVSDYEAFRHRELGTAADQPHRIKYKKFAKV